MAPRRRGRLRRRAGGVVAAMLLGMIAVASTSSVAGAHAGLLATSPVPDQVLTASPSEVRLVFSEAVDAGIGGIDVLDPDGRPVDLGVVNRTADGRTLIVPMDGAAVGTHTVAWRVVSSDGHTVSGSFVFHVGRRTGGAQVEARSDAPTKVVEWVGRAAALGGLILLLGALWMGGPNGIDRLRRLERASAGALLGGAVISLWSRGAEAGGRPLWRSFGSVGRLVTDTWAGGVEAVRIALAVVAVVLVWRNRRLAVMAVAFAVMTTFPLAGHAWSSAPVALAVMLDATHLAAVSVWVGGVVALLVALGARDAGAAAGLDGAWAAGMVRQASRGFVVAAPLVFVTGVLSTGVHIGGPGDLGATGWGRAVLVKLALATGALALGWWHRRRLVELVIEGVGRLTSLRAESTLMLAAVGVTAALVTMVPAEVALDRPFSARRATPAGVVQLDVTPARGGVNDVHLAFLRDAATDRPVDAVALAISSDGVPRRSVPVQLDGASHAFAMGVSFGPPGSWKVHVTTVYRGIRDATTFELELR